MNRFMQVSRTCSSLSTVNYSKFRDKVAPNPITGLALFTLAITTLGIPSASIAQSAPPSREEAERVLRPEQLPAGESVIALVNDDVITTFDLKQRLRLMHLSSGGQLQAAQLPQLRQQALQELINDKLKKKELDKFEVKVGDQEIESELRQISAQAGLTIEELQKAVNEQGITIDSFKQQISTSIGWQNLVQGRFRDRVKINQREVDQTIETIRDNATKERFLVSEICIPVDDQRQIQVYYEAGLQLIEQLRRGVPFSVAAREFSGCTSATVGGDIGWVQAGELEKELDDAIKAIPVGSVTNPIPSEGALIILALRDKQEPREPGEKSFTLAYASAPLSVGENNARLAIEKLPTAEVCNSRSLKLDLGPDVSTTLLENVKLTEIDERFRRFIDDLDRGDLSSTIEADGYLHVVHVCEKDEGLGIPPRVAIEDRIFGRQISLLGQRYLRDIERTSTVEYKERSR